MIDYEVKIFNNVYEVAAPLCAKNMFRSTQSEDLTAFPAATLVELTNTTVRERQSSTPGENFARIAYQLDVYAQKRTECRKVFSEIDRRMLQLNFSRISGPFEPGLDNPKVFRYVARYEAEIDTEGRIYRIP